MGSKRRTALALVALPLVAIMAFLGAGTAVAGAQDTEPPATTEPPPPPTTQPPTTQPPTTQPPTTTTPPPPPLWNPPPRVARVDVNLRNQRVYVVGSDGRVMREMPMSSGRNGSTPKGSFRVYSRSAWTTSLSSSRVSMRWMTRFNRSIGFHGIPRRGGQPIATPLGQRAVSAGCVRLADGDAEWIFRNVPNGTTVNVISK
jgi:lipoprotein-anchoring transpeptidase ErfK/SrfK